eukprot:gnl/TRDRNA2_/TRDRNA2_155372_c0_seq1.p1 gnl/TRDRNA2_/TRDRNA2_155372_c0~~gnl/TRDRNA2_/TRDRNA2_155372_c0_seq1.p1  ORF type:complete len:234 (-),score=69.90 gnl/TRDRNA2_/TRDRNA2_155372_c0_seq1:202-903(-)
MRRTRWPCRGVDQEVWKVAAAAWEEAAQSMLVPNGDEWMMATALAAAATSRAAQSSSHRVAHMWASAAEKWEQAARQNEKTPEKRKSMQIDKLKNELKELQAVAEAQEQGQRIVPLREEMTEKLDEAKKALSGLEELEAKAEELGSQLKTEELGSHLKRKRSEDESSSSQIAKPKRILPTQAVLMGIVGCCAGTWAFAKLRRHHGATTEKEAAVKFPDHYMSGLLIGSTDAAV